MNTTHTARITLIALLAAAGLAAGAAVAQPMGYGPGYRAGYGPGAGPCWRGAGPRANWGNGDWVQSRLDRMSVRLNLTPEQKAKLEPILRQRQELRAAQQAAMRQEVEAILTPEQRTLYQQMGPGRGGWGRGFGYGPGAAAATTAPATQP